MNTWDAITTKTNEVFKQTEINSVEELALLRRALTLYAEAFQFVNDPTNPQASIVRLALLSQTLNSIKLSVDTACQGFYIQSASLLRNVYENWLAFWYLAKYPNEANRWLDVSHRQPPPKAETMRNKVDHPSKNTKKRLHDAHEILSRFNHTDPVSVLSQIITVTGKSTVRVGVEYNRGHFDVCAYACFAWIGNMLDAIDSIVPDDHIWHKDHEKLGAELLYNIEKYNKSHPEG